MDFVYWRHPTLPGIKVEEVSGGEHYKGNVWREMALQVYCENGKDAYREVGHFRNGAPFLNGDSSRISISHCDGLYVVATLPSTPEVQLENFSRRAALGVDAERADREQVLKLREKFLSPAELAMIPADNVEQNVLAWTIKEAVYKAALQPGVDFSEEILIEKMPVLGPPTSVFDAAEFGIDSDKKALPDYFLGRAKVVRDGFDEEFLLYSYRSDLCIVTLAFSRGSAKFGKS